MSPFFIYDEKGNQIGMTEKEFTRYCEVQNLIKQTEELINPKYEQYMTESEKKEFLSLSI